MELFESFADVAVGSILGSAAGRAIGQSVGSLFEHGKETHAHGQTGAVIGGILGGVLGGMLGEAENELGRRKAEGKEAPRQKTKKASVDAAKPIPVGVAGLFGHEVAQSLMGDIGGVVQPLTHGIVKSVSLPWPDKDKYTKPTVINIEDFSSNGKRMDFIVEHLATGLDESDELGYEKLGDGETIVARVHAISMTVAEAMECGIILPPDVVTRAATNPRLRVCVLVIKFFGVGSGSTSQQLLSAAQNTTNGSMGGILERTETMVVHRIEEEKARFANNPNVVVVPVISGFSFGGIIANAVATKLDVPSCTFNSPPLGRAACEHVGVERWNRQRPNIHINFLTKGDFLAGKSSLLVDDDGGLHPGSVINLPENSGGFDPVGAHCEYKKHLECYQEQMRTAPIKVAGAPASAPKSPTVTHIV
jgi:hypothetical protein